jgi:hypothetical protein
LLLIAALRIEDFRERGQIRILRLGDQHERREEAQDDPDEEQA